MTGPSSTPRGEHTPRPGITWTTTVGWSGEQLVDDDAPDPTPPNRATRRAAARAARRGSTGRVEQHPGLPSADTAREAPSEATGGPVSAPRTRSGPREPEAPQGASQGRTAA